MRLTSEIGRLNVRQSILRDKKYMKKGKKFKYRKTAKRKAETNRWSNIFNGFAYKWELIDSSKYGNPCTGDEQENMQIF